ncbi:MAG: hypothetical protein ACREBS_11240 [Nitrososphaerales archaeon]
MPTRNYAIVRGLGIAVVILVIVTGLTSYSLGYLNQPAPATTITTRTESYTITQYSTIVQVTFITKSGSTITVVQKLPEETITEVIINKMGTAGGGGFCQGSSLSACTGYATIGLTVEESTSYTFSSTSNSYFNATITTTTSYGTIICVDPTTSTTTAAENSTYIWIGYTWSFASCSG